jgi:DNA-3-methyladenine glycosylase
MAAARRARLLSRSFYARSPLAVAPELLNKVVRHGDRAGRIVEVEAYCGLDDPASHAFRGPTPRAAIMFDRPGHLYVYFSYGMHWCANVVAHERDHAGAVLLRAIEPVEGIDAMRAARPKARRDTDVGNGPGKLTQALGIDGQVLGVDLRASTSPVHVLDDGTPPPDDPVVGPRIGIKVAVDEPWRFSVPGNPHRSKPW